MNLTPTHLYHIYNRGNNKETIFYKKNNYYFFIEKIRRYIEPNCEILAYCLMPNHFHILICANEKSIRQVKAGACQMSYVSNGVKKLLSSYTKAINKQEGRSGSLFTQNTKIKNLQDWNNNLDYSNICFEYIHKNPIKARIVNKFEDWPFYSYHEYKGRFIKGLCNIEYAKQTLDIDWDSLSSKEPFEEKFSKSYTKLFDK